MYQSPFVRDFLKLNLDAEAMDHRLKARLSRVEFLGVVTCLVFVGVFIWVFRINGSYPADFGVYLEGRSSPLFCYGYWILPLFSFLKILPPEISYAAWSLLTILGLLFASRIFGGKAFLVLLSYQALAILFYGQISGILAGGLALCWWGIAHHRWNIAGLGLLIAVSKFQLGLFVGGLLIWYAGVSWYHFLRMLVVPFVLGLTSLFLYPLWPLEVLYKLLAFPNMHLGITFWNYIGAWSLLFWIPALLLPLSKPERFLSIFSLIIFAVPYFLQFDLITLFTFPISWLPLLGYLGFLFPFFDLVIIRILVVIPFLLYLSIILPAGYVILRQVFFAPSPTDCVK
jgi:hypothetical protein